MNENEKDRRTWQNDFTWPAAQLYTRWVFKRNPYNTGIPLNHSLFIDVIKQASQSQLIDNFTTFSFETNGKTAKCFQRSFLSCELYSYKLFLSIFNFHLAKFVGKFSILRIWSHLDFDILMINIVVRFSLTKKLSWIDYHRRCRGCGCTSCYWDFVKVSKRNVGTSMKETQAFLLLSLDNFLFIAKLWILQALTRIIEKMHQLEVNYFNIHVHRSVRSVLFMI